MDTCPAEFPLSWLNEQLDKDDVFAQQALLLLRRRAELQPTDIRETHTVASSARALVNSWLVNRKLYGYDRGRPIDDFTSFTLISFWDDLETSIRNLEAMITIKRVEVVSLILEESLTPPQFLLSDPLALLPLNHSGHAAMIGKATLTAEPTISRVAAAPAIQIVETGIKKREQQIRVIEAVLATLKYPAMSVPTGSKKKVEAECKRAAPSLFGVGPDPFKQAWQEAVTQKRVRTENHENYR